MATDFGHGGARGPGDSTPPTGMLALRKEKSLWVSEEGARLSQEIVRSGEDEDPANPNDSSQYVNHGAYRIAMRLVDCVNSSSERASSGGPPRKTGSGSGTHRRYRRLAGEPAGIPFLQRRGGC